MKKEKTEGVKTAKRTRPSQRTKAVTPVVLAKIESELNGMTSFTKELATVEQINVFHGASMLTVTESEKRLLTEPVIESLVEIRPDGLLYLPQAFVRRKLNEVFGYGQWCLLRRNITVDKENGYVYYEGILMVRGFYVSEAVGEQPYFTNNPQQSWASAVEAAKSDCIVRCCKDLGVASELWQPQFGREWQSNFAIQVWVEKSGQSKPAWRKKTSAPFWNEKGVVGDKTKQPPPDTKTVKVESDPPEVQSQQAPPPPPPSIIEDPKAQTATAKKKILHKMDKDNNFTDAYLNTLNKLRYGAVTVEVVEQYYELTPELRKYFESIATKK